MLQRPYHIGGVDKNFESVRNQWLEYAAERGKEIRVRLPGREMQVGIFQTIDENGMLMLKTPEGQTRRISVGDVFFGNGQLGSKFWLIRNSFLFHWGAWARSG